MRFRGNAPVFVGAGALILVYLFAPFFILQFISLFLLFLIIGSKMYSEYLLRNLRLFRREGDLRNFRSEWANVELVVENRGRLPAFMLAVTDSPGRLSVFRENKRLCTLRSRSRLVLSWQTYCSSRGIFSVGPATVRGGDPLGLFPFFAAAPETTRLVVYPPPGHISLGSPGGIPQGTRVISNPLYEDVTRRRSLREYQAGDETRRINWKASARMSVAAPRGGFPNASLGNQKLLVNEYEAAISYPLVVFLNLDPYEYGLRQRELYFERTIEAAASLCMMASREGQELGIMLYNPHEGEGFTFIKPGAFTLLPILERLAGLERAGEPRSDAAEQRPLRGSARLMLDRGKFLPYGTRLVYTGPDFSDEEYIALNSLKRHHLSLEYLIIDERHLAATVPGNSPRYQMKEGGYEII
ncbi:hypothetical protein FACS1894163_01850 [Spirochaetia bacterium]|nr:hypothetical protein FACS1894163_01850 [Spirochaetia bacterium]